VTEQPPLSIPLRSLLFQLSDISQISYSSAWQSETFQAATHALLIFTDGEGSLNIDGELFRLMKDQCFLLSPNTVYTIENGCERALQFHRIEFVIYRTGLKSPQRYQEAIFPDRLELIAYPFTRLTRLVEEVIHEQENECDLDWFQRQLHFQELIGFLCQHNLPEGNKASVSRSVENSIQYLRKNYTQPHTVKQLAELAGVPYWRYTPIFQELTGQKPLDFLTELRIQQAKLLLRSTNEPLRKIAQRVGFTDEYYFNRRFRQTTGLTPKQYARQASKGNYVKDWCGHEVEIPNPPKRIIYHGETYGDLLALGLQPVGGSLAFTSGHIYEGKIQDMKDVGFPISPQKSFTLKPDLIIMASSDEEQYDQISRIAPTLTFNSFASLDERLHTLGSWLGRRKEAASWLQRYHSKASAMWKQLESQLTPGETASVFIHEHGSKLFVMGTTGLSSALYHPHGFRAVDKINKLLQEGIGFAEITTAELPLYAGDRIFMLLSTNDESRKATMSLMESRLWQELSAVQRGHVYLIEADHWNLNDALTKEKLLDDLPELISSIRC